MTRDSGGDYLRSKYVPAPWGDPIRCVAWFDRFGRCRTCVGHYANGRAALVRADANGKWRTEFSNASASVDTLPKGRDGEAGSVRSKGGAARSEAEGDAQ